MLLRENITVKEKEALKNLAKVYFNYNEYEIYQAIKAGELIEIREGNQSSLIPSPPACGRRG